MLVLAALLIAVPQGAEVAPVQARPVCRVTTVTPARVETKPTVHPLDREPNATQVLAVLRTDGGCIKPVVVHDSVGLAAPRP